MPTSITRTETDTDTGEEAERDIHYMKGYTVFNVEQIEGLARAILREGDAAASIRFSASTQAEAFLAATRADLRHGGNRAYYSVAQDRMQMPPFETFRDAESYYADSRA